MKFHILTMFTQVPENAYFDIAYSSSWKCMVEEFASYTFPCQFFEDKVDVQLKIPMVVDMGMVLQQTKGDMPSVI